MNKQLQHRTTFLTLLTAATSVVTFNSVLAQPTATPQPVALAQAASTQSDANAQNPAQIKSLHLDAGYLANFQSGEHSALYYRLEYRGKLLREKGTPFSYLNLNQPVASSLKPDASNPGGDTNKYIVRLERGTGSIDGGIFDALGARQLQFGGFLRSLRGAAQLSGRLDGEQLNIALGLETPPIHPLRPLNRATRAGITNWLILGLVGETRPRSQDEDEDNNKDAALATYRAFAGRGFRWVRSQRLDKVLVEEVLGKAPTYQAAQTEGAAILGRIAGQQQVPSPIESVVIGLSNEPAPADYQTLVGRAVQAFNAPADQPTYALWVEGAGWYAVSRDINARRFNNLFAATVTYWLNPKAGGTQWLRLRYELGRERAAPSVRKNFLALSIGTDF